MANENPHIHLCHSQNYSNTNAFLTDNRGSIAKPQNKYQNEFIGISEGRLLLLFCLCNNANVRHYILYKVICTRNK